MITCIFCFFNSEVKNETLRIINRNLLVYETNRISKKTKAECRIHNSEYRRINQPTAQDTSLVQFNTDNGKSVNINLRQEAPLVRFTKGNSESLSSLNSLIHFDIGPGAPSKQEQRELTNEKKKRNQNLNQNYLSIKKYFKTLKEKHQYHGDEGWHKHKRNSSTPNISSCSEYDHSNRRNTRKLSLDYGIFNRQISANNNGTSEI